MKTVLAAHSPTATGPSVAATPIRSPLVPPPPVLCSLSSVLFLLLTSCTHIGPKTVPVDRFDYSTAIGESWKQQTLLNIVKLRYMDLPVFVDVASVVSGYSLETALSAGGSFPQTGGNTASVGGSAKFTDRPTITYVPMTGEKFMHGLITPIDPKNIFFSPADTGSPEKLPLITIPAQ